MSVLELVRPDLRAFTGYASARRENVSGTIWINANESPYVNPADAGGAANRYPEPQPAALTRALADLYGTTPEQILVGRGSDEAIDLLVRVFCRPGEDAITIAPPVFGMYAVSARLQGAGVLEVPLRDGPGGFSSDVEALAATAIDGPARVIFLCSPANPTGQSTRLDEIGRLAERVGSRAVLVVDEAYGEYGTEPSAVSLVGRYPNLVVLRTLSKAHGLAAARIGCLVADPALVRVLGNCQAPYPLPLPAVRLALDALEPEVLEITRSRIVVTIAERGRVADELATLPGVRRVYPSTGNFLLVRFNDAEAAFRRLLAAGVVVRDMRTAPQLDDALRISIGRPEENDAVLLALGDLTDDS